VDSTRKELFASAGLTDQQNGDAATRCYLSRECDNLADRGTLTDDVSVPAIRRRKLRSG
jgi:hypothetical protein